MTLDEPYADTTLGAACCIHCGQVPHAHHSDERCYTTDELLTRLRFAQREGRWPGPDEGCEDEEELHAQ